jgi:hypothetical protein
MNEVLPLRVARRPDMIMESLHRLRFLSGTPEENAVALLMGVTVERVRELGGVAQVEEQRNHTPKVSGSTPLAATKASSSVVRARSL